MMARETKASQRICEHQTETKRCRDKKVRRGTKERKRDGKSQKQFITVCVLSWLLCSNT